MVMRDLALKAIQDGSFTIDANTYFTNEYVYAKDVALALDLACRAQNPKQRVYNAGSGVVTKAADLARVVRELAPKAEVKLIGAGEEEGHREFALDLSRSKAELDYSPQFSIKEGLRDYMEELWAEGARG
jgi:nucleoside-diphosphate-sugar epimerase